MTKPTTSAPLIKMIKLEAKKVRINENGSFSWYAEISTWMPKTKKKHPTQMRRICRIHQMMPAIKHFQNRRCQAEGGCHKKQMSFPAILQERVRVVKVILTFFSILHIATRQRCRSPLNGAAKTEGKFWHPQSFSDSKRFQTIGDSH